jgi:transcriptional regulator with XRE-family HTH domain
MSAEPTSLGIRLRAARERAGLTLREVEERTGISNAYLSQIESGRIKEPSPRVLHRLAELYGESYAELLELAGYPVPEAGEGRRSRESSLHAHGRLGSVTHEEEAELLEYLKFIRTRSRRSRP